MGIIWSKKLNKKKLIYHIIQRLFGRLKENKRTAMSFDKLDSTFLSFIALAVAKLFKLFC